ncbi:MAG: hypothetical protein MZW92_04805 [Comamonadaceae bacterium]|nr:hypothetical protein [Comamonadaceae bacterium]
MPPDLIVGHGVLGRLLARMTRASPATRRRRSGRRNAERARRRRAATRCCDPTTTRAATTAPSTTSAATRAILDTPGRAPGAGRRDRAGRLLHRAAVASASRRRSCARRSIRVAAEWQRPDLLAVQASWPRPAACRSTA